MINKIKNIFVIPELKNRVLFTLGVLITVRLGAHIPIPGIDTEVLSAAFQNYHEKCRDTTPTNPFDAESNFLLGGGSGDT